MNLPAALHSLFFSLRSVLRSLLDNQPSSILLRQTARNQWRLITLNFSSSLLEAASEAGTLALVFVAVKVLSSPPDTSLIPSSSFLVLWWPGFATLVNSTPVKVLFLFILLLAVMMQAFQSFSKFLNAISTAYFGARCRAIVSAKIHSQILGITFSCASNYKVGDLTDYIFWGPESIRIQIEQYSSLLVGSLLGITYLSVLTTISPWLLLVVAFMALLISLLQAKLLPKIRFKAQEVSKAQVEVSSRMTENFQGLRLLHSTGQLDKADQILRHNLSYLEQMLRGQGFLSSIIGPFISFLPILTIAVLAGLSILFLGDKSQNVLPKLVTFMFALQRLNSRIHILNSNLNLLAQNKGNLSRLNTILNSDDKEFRRGCGIKFNTLQSHILFKSVGLQYEKSLAPALSNISFLLSKGQTVALVGSSGAGKSSIADLLIGLYSPTIGEIQIDNIPLEKIELASWQQRIGVVSQETFLFNTTISENVSFGTPSASQSMIEQACIAAQASDFINKLPLGYDTLVGERGYRLSGGQRQRLSLARAILRDPDLLILDEATSALDSENERLVQEAIKKFENNHTVLVIAHRLSTIVAADLIIVLDGGHVIEQGTHNVLLDNHGAYFDLWNPQCNLPSLGA